MAAFLGCLWASGFIGAHVQPGKAASLSLRLFAVTQDCVLMLFGEPKSVSAVDKAKLLAR
ncbi:MAG: hypothetical protein ABL974_15895 [Prosthecobacter sp.]